MQVKGDVALLFYQLLNGKQAFFQAFQKVVEEPDIVKGVIFSNETFKQVSHLFAFDKKAAPIFIVYVKSTCLSMLTNDTIF